MGSLIEELPARIAKLESRFGPNDPFVKDLKEQLRASIATQGKSAQEVFRMQSVSLAPTSANAPETEADGEAVGALRIARMKHQNEQFRKKT